AGLASALALTRRGWRVEVFERAPEFTEVGAGLSLWPNALRALDALGVGEGVRGRAVLEGQAGIRDAAGRWLSRTDTAELERRYAGYTAWRVVTAPVLVGEASESWGRGERFGYIPLPDGRVYCYAAANAPEGAPDSGLTGLHARFGGWHHPIPALLDAADPGA